MRLKNETIFNIIGLKLKFATIGVTRSVSGATKSRVMTGMYSVSPNETLDAMIVTAGIQDAC